LVLISPTPPFILQGVGLQGRSESVIIIPDWDTISTCLFYKIYLLYYVGYGLYYLPILQDLSIILCGLWALLLGPLGRVGWLLVGPPFLLSKFGWSGTHGTKRCQQHSGAWQVNIHLVILNLPCSWWSCRVFSFVKNNWLSAQHCLSSATESTLMRIDTPLGAPIMCSPRLQYQIS
jgi:hypothetical protein